MAVCIYEWENTATTFFSIKSATTTTLALAVSFIKKNHCLNKIIM